MSEEHAAFRVCVGELNWVGGTEEPHLLRGRDINTPATEPLRNRRVHVLIKMKANRPGHWPSVP